jgi:hypothetical protein
VTIAYWLDYGVALHIPESTKQWRVPVAVQLVPGGIMLIGLFFLTESPRWLMKKGRHEEALASLAYIRCEKTDSPDIVKEMAEIRAAIDEELHLTEGVTWKECLKKGVRERFLIGFMIMFWQQFSGTNSIGYAVTPVSLQCFPALLHGAQSPQSIILTEVLAGTTRPRSSRPLASPKPTHPSSQRASTALSRSFLQAFSCSSVSTASAANGLLLQVQHGWLP